jgi:hypothetical protein
MEGRVVKSCRKCNRTGHLAAKCPHKNDTHRNLFEAIALPSDSFKKLAEKLRKKSNHADLAEVSPVADKNFRLPQKKKKKKKGPKLSLEEVQDKIMQEDQDAQQNAAKEAQIAQEASQRQISERLSQLDYTKHSEVRPRPSLREIMSHEASVVEGKHSKVKPPPRGERTQISQQPTTKGFR